MKKLKDSENQKKNIFFLPSVSNKSFSIQNLIFVIKKQMSLIHSFLISTLIAAFICISFYSSSVSAACPYAPGEWVSCSGSGDVHFISLDQVYYDFMGVGTYALFDSPNLFVSLNTYACGATVSCSGGVTIWANDPTTNSTAATKIATIGYTPRIQEVNGVTRDCRGTCLIGETNGSSTVVEPFRK